MTRWTLILAPIVGAVGCTCPCEEHSPPTGDTGTELVVEGIDLATPSGDDDYDRYTSAIMGLDDLAISPDVVAQIDMGIANVFGPVGAGNIGTVYTEKKAEHRFVEHWFLTDDDDDYFGGGAFGAQYVSAGSANQALTMHESLDPQWMDHTYLCMDIEYKQSPQDLDELDYEGKLVEGFVFDVEQDLGNGLEKTASLLRELHHHPQLGDLYVDFWTFSASFDFLDQAKEQFVATLEDRQGPPPNLWYGGQNNNQTFARLMYYVEEGSDFEPGLDVNPCQQ
ncbi:MAG: hypothetical protein KTR31_11460 [Myxococcales bacterium]|nr:hypothetical protein [Myxococcales bacterium]